MSFRHVLLIAALFLLPWVGHSQTLEQLRELLQQRPEEGLAFEFYLNELTSQQSLASEITEFAELARKDHAPQNTALQLSLLLDATWRYPESIVVLRRNAQKHSADRVALTALARACSAGDELEQEEVLMRLYELPAPPHQRLECLRKLAIVKQSHGRLREMRDSWAKRPKDAYGWLELGVLQRRAGEDEEWRRCVYEASRLRPKNVLLLEEIARQEAGLGFIKEALATLDAADAVAKAVSTLLLRCLIQLETNEEEKALAALTGLKLPADADLELVRALADKLAQQSCWDAAVKLLNQALTAHSTDYQLCYLRAVALEELGRREAAAGAFKEIFAIKSEMPADETHWYERTFQHPDDISLSPEGLKLPAGTLGLMQSHKARWNAYDHQKGPVGACICFAYTQVEDAPRASFIRLPSSLLDAKYLALPHLQRLLPCLADERRTEAEKAVLSGGLVKPELLLHARGIKSPALLAQHPRDLALHAARLLSLEHGEDLPLAVWDEQVALFRDAFPDLAFLAACHALHAAQPGSGASRRVEVLHLAEKATSCPQVIDALLNLMSQRYVFKNSGRRDDDETSATAEDLQILTRAVDLVLHLPVVSAAMRESAISSVLKTAVSNKAMPEAIRLLRGLASTTARVALAEPALTLGEPVGVLLQTRDWPGIANLDLARLAAPIFGDFTAWRFPKERMDQMRAQLVQVPEAEVRRTLELCMGDYSGMEAESRQRLAKPQPTLNDHFFAVALAQAQNDPDGALQHLAAASAMTQDAAQLRRIDQAALSAARNYQKKKEMISGPLKAFVLASAQRWLSTELHPAAKEAANEVMRAFLSNAEAEQLYRKMREEKQARNEESGNTPYSRNAAAQRSEAESRKTMQLLQAALKKHDMKTIATLGRYWLGLQEDYYLSRESIESQVGGTAAFHILLQACRPDKACGESILLHHADSLITLGESEAALQIYTELAERDPHACLPRLHAARLLAEKAPDLALAQLRSIRVESALPDVHGRSPLNILMQQNASASERIAVTELVVRWLNSMPDLSVWREVLDSTTCSSLIWMIQRGEQGESGDDLRFPALNEPRSSTEYFIPTGRGAAQMKQARHAHDELCRAMLRLPGAQPAALRELSSVVLQEDGDLAECASLTTAMLRKAQTKQSGVENDGDLFATTSPFPITVLVRHAAQTRDFARFEKEDLPLIEQALGASAATRARLYAKLFSTAEANYPSAAADWLASQATDETSPETNQEEVLNVWQRRRLKIPLEEMLLQSQPVRRDLMQGKVPGAVTHYITLLGKAGRQQEIVSCAKKLRDAMSSGDAAERRSMIAEWHKEKTYRGIKQQETPAPPSHISQFAEWLLGAMRDPAMLCLLPLLLEDGLLSGPDDLSKVAYEMMTAKMLRDPTAGITFAEQLGFLSEAAAWHDHVLHPDSDPRTWISSLASRLRDLLDTQDTQRMRKMLAARRPQTLGCEVFAALLAHCRSDVLELSGRASEEKRDVLLHEVLLRRKAELSEIPQEQRRVFSLMLRSELPGYSDFSKLDADLAAALQPFRDEEADALVPELDRFLAAREWTEVGLSVNEFSWRFSTMLAQAARRHPAKVAAVVRHACELLKKTPEDEEQRFFGKIYNSPTGNFLRELGRVPQVLGTTMELVEKEKLSENLGWMPNFANQLTDYKLINNQEHLEAIFTLSPLTADVEHFQDFALSLQIIGESASLLDRIIHRLNETNAQWLQQKLKSAPKQTFGAQLALALLESNAPARKAGNCAVRPQPDAAPVAAFAAAHAADIKQLPPATAKVVHHLIESYLNPPKPPPPAPLQETPSSKEPFDALPPAQP